MNRAPLSLFRSIFPIQGLRGGLLAVFLVFFYSTLCCATLIENIDPFAPYDTNGLSPFWKWKTIESKNFRVSFPAELGIAAQKATHHLEEAHRILSPLLKWQPHNKTQVVLVDNQDFANGLTTAQARLGLVLWVTPPDSWLGTVFYDDWIRLLVIHEYTHMLNIDTTDSFWQPLRYIFGDTLLPNAIWAPWMLEGLAVYMETRFTKSGRGRGSFYEMILRAAVEENVLNTSRFITLDKINGTNPYFPSGDTRYQFGYPLMNQISKQPVKGTTADGETKTPGGDDLLGILSKRSGARIPFFINGNLENIIGKNWYQLWDEWVSETIQRMSRQLKKIRSQPVTSFEPILDRSYHASNDVAGSAASPDGLWIAYTVSSANMRQSLFLKNLKTGEARKLDDKLFGVGMKFTPDSKALLYSIVERKDNYTLFSDLTIYQLDTDSHYLLTRQARAKDPDISRDGRWVTFTLTKSSFNEIVIAPLNLNLYKNEKYSLGKIEKIYTPSQYDHVANPQFSIDGQKIFFSFHPNGKFQEDILEIQLSSRKTRILASDGSFNRYPAINGNGELFFVSNRTGVDNLFHFIEGQSPKMVTNLTTGLAFPSFIPTPGRSDLYASVYSTSGGGLAKITLSEQGIPSQSVKIDPPPAPPIGENSTATQQQETYSEKDYSIFPSILPRIWFPLLGADPSGTIFGGEVYGFDAINQHRYVLAGSYQSQLNVGDAFALYSNRSLGAEIKVSADVLTTGVNLTPASGIMSREIDFTSGITFPVLGTYSNFFPSINLNWQKLLNYQTSSTGANRVLNNVSPIVPSLDASMIFSNLEISNLSITYESGRYSQLGLRRYFNGPESDWKLLFVDQEYFSIAPHTSLIPSIQATWVSNFNPNFPPSNALVQGRLPENLVNAFPTDSFNQTSIRGYPTRSFLARSAATFALDLRFPISRIFRGAATLPLFLDNLYGFTFIEATYFPSTTSSLVLPSVGGGLRLMSELFFYPITFSGEYHQGLRPEYGGTADLFLQILLTVSQF